MEIRSLAAPPQAEGRRLFGYAARFDSPSRVLTEKGKTFREVVVPGAFARSLAAPLLGSVVALWDHGKDGRPPLARTPGTLRLWEDGQGLGFEFELPQSAEDIREAVQRGDVWGMSFGFRNEQAKWYTRDGMPWRDLSALDLVEISLTTHPAYQSTSVQARGVSAVLVPDQVPADVPTADLRTARRRLALAERV